MYTKCLVTHQDTTPDQQQDAGKASTIHHKTRAKTSSKGFQILSYRNIFFFFFIDTILYYRNYLALKELSRGYKAPY